MANTISKLLMGLLGTAIVDRASPVDTINTTMNDDQGQIIKFRDGYNGAEIWNDLASCIRNATNMPAIIDASNTIDLSSFTVWLDAGNNYEKDVDEVVEQNILDCFDGVQGVERSNVLSHNSYAVAGSYDEEEEMFEHYEFYGHGMVDEYEPGAHSPEETTSLFVDKSESLAERGKNQPDAHATYWRSLIGLGWYAAKNTQINTKRYTYGDGSTAAWNR